MKRKILGRLNHLFGIVVSAKQARRHRRLLRAYPWLWAIRGIWHPGAAEIQESKDEAELGRILTRPCIEKQLKELWIRESLDALEAIVRIEPRDTDDYRSSWAERILNELPQGYALKNIVIVTAVEEGKERFVIYRRARRRGSLTELIQLLARLPRETSSLRS